MVHCHPVGHGFYFFQYWFFISFHPLSLGILLATDFGWLIMRLTVEQHWANVYYKQPYITQLK